MPYGDFKDLIRWTASDQILLNKTFNIAKNRKYDGYQRGLTSMIYKIFDKKSSGRIVKKGNITTKELAKKLQKTINKKIEKRKVDSPFQRQCLGCWACWYVIIKQI